MTTSSPMADALTPTAPPLLQALTHWYQASGNYSKETFVALFGALVGWVRDVSASGNTPLWVMTADGDDETFKLLVSPLQQTSAVEWLDISSNDVLPTRAGCLVIVSTVGSVALSWQVDQRQALQMYHGGWTFRPGDARAVCDAVLNYMAKQPNDVMADTVAQWQTALASMPTGVVDPRLPALTQALVQGLERQSHQLDAALQEVHHLNQKVVDSERLAAIGQLCSVVAHEIRNPLGLIDLYAKLIESQAEKWLVDLKTEHPAIKDTELPFGANINMVREAIQGLEVILSELTQYSRPMEVNTECVAVLPIVKNIVQFYAPKYVENNVKLTVEYNPDVAPYLQANLDAARFRQGLINLLKNALEASLSAAKSDRNQAAGQNVTVVVASRQTDKDIYIKVMDEAGGVPERSQEKLFTPYFSTKGNGTGLGLAHTRKILQAHGGRAELLRSEEGIGSTFALIVPRQVDATEKAEGAGQ